MKRLSAEAELLPATRVAQKQTLKALITSDLTQLDEYDPLARGYARQGRVYEAVQQHEALLAQRLPIRAQRTMIGMLNEA